MPEQITGENSYGLFRDWDSTLKSWFYPGHRTTLKNVKIEHVLNGITCQPISLQDFRFFLQNKEHSGENLDFYFWYLGYKKRFEKLSDEEKAKSPPPKERPSPGVIYSDGKKGEKEDMAYDEDDEEKKRLNQPFREEVEAIALTFFHEDSFKELNVDSYLSRFVTYYSSQTTHPDIFEDVHQHIFNILKTSSFPSFIHYGTINIRYSFWVIQYAGTVFNALNIPVVLFYTFSHHMSRWYRCTLFWFGFFFAASLLSGRAGFCTIRGVGKFRQIPLYEYSEYKVELGSAEKFIKNGPMGLPMQPDLDADLEKSDAKKKSLTEIQDPEVLKYSRQMLFHIYFASTLFASLITIIGVSITNEYDVPPAPPMPA